MSSQKSPLEKEWLRLLNFAGNSYCRRGWRSLRCDLSKTNCEICGVKISSSVL